MIQPEELSGYMGAYQVNRLVAKHLPHLRMLANAEKDDVRREWMSDVATLLELLAGAAESNAREAASAALSIGEMSRGRW